MTKTFDNDTKPFIVRFELHIYTEGGKIGYWVRWIEENTDGARNLKIQACAHDSNLLVKGRVNDMFSWCMMRIAEEGIDNYILDMIAKRSNGKSYILRHKNTYISNPAETLDNVFTHIVRNEKEFLRDDKNI